jgi:hypothetical protein
MKWKAVIVDLELPPWVNKWGLPVAGALVVVVGGGAIAYAAGLVTWSNGQTLNASDLNTNFSYLQGQISAQASTIAVLQGQVHPPSAFQAQLTNATAIAPSVITPLVFNSVSFDLAREYDPTMGTFSPKQAGVYLVQCGTYFLGVPGTVYNASISKNGVEVSGFDTQASSSSEMIDTATSGIVQLAAGDSLRCSTYQQSGTSQTIANSRTDRDFFSAARLY